MEGLNVPKFSQHIPSTATPSYIEVFLSNSLVNPTNEPSSDDLISLATISTLDNMAISISHQTASTVVIINETIESPLSESAHTTSVISTIAQVHSTVHRENSKIVEPDFGSNKFSSLRRKFTRYRQ